MYLSIILGDYLVSEDSKTHCNEYIAIIPDDFTLEDLKRNYSRNVESLGFSLSDIASEPSENYIKSEHVIKLTNLGFKISTDHITIPMFSDEYEKGQGIYSWDKPFTSHDDKCFIDDEILLQIFMFLSGHGLQNFSWKPLRPESFFEIIEDTPGHRKGIGYGLHSYVDEK